MNTITTKDEKQLSRSGRSPARERLTPENATLFLIDHQSRVRNAVKRTGRRKLLIAGITTPVCLTSAATSAASDGYDVYALLDASGTWRDLLRLTAIEQMKQAGVTITSGVAAFTEMLRDNASPLASEYYAALDLPATRYILQITQADNNTSKQRAA